MKVLYSILSKSLIFGGLFIVLTGFSACGSRYADYLNPFTDNSGPELGERTNKALLGEGGGRGGVTEAERARRALEVNGSYRAALAPQPYNPVWQPAVVRLMWVPDHLNSQGDLIPAHYYYLRVLNDRPAVTDAFELEQQLNQGSGGTGSNTPWTYKSGK